MLGRERIVEQGQAEDGGSDGGDPDQECIISKIGMPVAQFSEIDSLLARSGLIRGPLGVLKHAGKAGLRVVGLEASGSPESGVGEASPSAD
jgi:hypothetical protein